MEPNYFPGDHVMTFNWIVPKTSDVMVAKIASTHYLKRVTKISKDLFYVSGDNSRATAKVGPLTKDQIVGKVILKY